MIFWTGSARRVIDKRWQ